VNGLFVDDATCELFVVTSAGVRVLSHHPSAVARKVNEVSELATELSDLRSRKGRNESEIPIQVAS
jgi:hypothetical protein